ncbi:hypothetical protein TL16_g06753 [Triparma laevis f. inornata]|uniref:Uncharacterized protein n=1 Tax=Triparma laevis f. inornata TaxID=1714386 RepID=A0A9W7APJ1_9STRA|nr:hypothetical protein TL16_g06753 [Triparma laevis f. inornata]
MNDVLLLLDEKDYSEEELKSFVDKASSKLKSKQAAVVGSVCRQQAPPVDKVKSHAVSTNPVEEQHTSTESSAKPEMNALGLGGESKEHVRNAAEQVLVVIRNSSGDVVKDVSTWAKDGFMTINMSEAEAENFTEFLVVIATRTRLLMKMSRIGVALKLAVTLSLGYADVLTDFLVAKSYYDAGKLSTAYATAGFAVFAIVVQAFFTFFQYGKKSWKERFGRSFAALLGLAPLLEGASIWTGKEDGDLLVSFPMMYAIMKGVEIAFESIPESIIQVNGLLKQQNVGDIEPIQIVGVISSIVSGAFIITDGNFGFILGKYLQSPGDPYFGWISMIGGWEKTWQMLSMFLFNACYFSQFVFAMSLFAQAFGSWAPVAILLGVEFCTVCVYMGWKGELFGFSVLSQTSTLSNFFFPFIVWAMQYLLVSAVPILIASAPMELGPEVFASTMVWRLLTNGGVVYVALGELVKKGHYLSLETGMAGYGISLVLAAVGLVIFFKNCNDHFDRSLFWRPKTGNQHMRDNLKDEKLWDKGCKSKDDEFWGWVGFIHPTYLDFDLMTPWICERLVEKYELGGLARPEWMDSENSEKFIKRITEVYAWKGSHEEEVDKALVKLFKRIRVDLEKGDDSLSLTLKTSPKMSPKSKHEIGKIKVHPEVVTGDSES